MGICQMDGEGNFTCNITAAFPDEEGVIRTVR